MNIESDLQAGDALVLLAHLRNQNYMPSGRNGKRLDKSVPFRWATRGCRGIVLETISTPGGKCTTKSALLRFYSALTGPQQQQPLPTSTPARRKREISRAAAELEAAGI